MEVKNINNSFVTSRVSTLQLIQKKHKSPNMQKFRLGLEQRHEEELVFSSLMMERAELLRGGWALPKACVPRIRQQRCEMDRNRKRRNLF